MESSNINFRFKRGDLVTPNSSFGACLRKYPLVERGIDGEVKRGEIFIVLSDEFIVGVNWIMIFVPKFGVCYSNARTFAKFA